jgi:hypothetical protein
MAGSGTVDMSAAVAKEPKALNSADAGLVPGIEVMEPKELSPAEIGSTSSWTYT